MSSAKMTLIGLNKYLSLRDEDLFKYLELPQGIDKEVLVNNILLKGSEFEVIYADVNFMQLAVGNWSKKWSRTFTKWIEALTIEYNPLENYDRIEEWNDKENSSSTGHSVDSNNSYGDSLNNVSSYDSDSLRPNTSTRSTTQTDGSTDLTNSGNREAIKTGRAHGNIGVTTSQQMLESELSIAQWNIYEHITDLFLQEFVIPLY